MTATFTPGPATTDAAILMLMFGEKLAAEVMRHLTPAEVQHLGAAMYAIDAVTEDQMDSVLETMLERLAAETGLGHGTHIYVRNVMTEALGPDRAQSVIRRIAQLTTVTPEALRDLEQVLQRKFKATSTSAASQIGGIRAAARIMNFARSGAEARILRDIRKDDKDLMTAIQDNMFVFDNLGRSDDRSLQTLLRAIEPERLVLALKGADEALRERLLSCMSSRAAAGIRDEMEALGPVRLTEVQEAQKQIVATARQMADAGTIVLAGRGGEEMV